MMTTTSAARRIDRVFRALGHGGRRHLLQRLAQRGGLTLGELCEDLPMSRQAVSQHLAVLAEADLVITRWQGRAKLHFLNPTPLCEAHDRWFAPLITRAAQALTALRADLEGEALAALTESEAQRRTAGGRGGRR